MKNLKILSYAVKPAVPEPNSLTVVNDVLYYYNENNMEFKMSGDSVDLSGLMVNTTYKDLLTLVNTNKLVAGQQYRITDYVATVDESVYNEDEVGFFARSNNHAFDIIVTADSENKLNENARAIRHEGDTYFPSHTKFESWKLKYTIFNDAELFDWADAIMGKGVIYQLIDEWNNDLPYDFKSIQFKRNDVWVYTFGGVADASLEVQNCIENKMLSTYSNVNDYGYGLNNNTFGNYCESNTFGSGYYLNTFGDGCYSNTFGNDCQSSTFGDNFSSNTFGNGCEANTFGDNCQSNNFGINCSSNIFGANCSSNTFGDYYEANAFGNFCSSNIFGDYCSSTTFGNYCEANTFGYFCQSNTFDNNYKYFNIGSHISNKDFTTLRPLFTTPPNNNEIKVTTSVNGAVMSQVINATTTESIDIEL